MILRPLTVFERDPVRTFYLALSQEDRRLRFCAMASDETVAAYVDRIDFARATVLGAFDERAQLIGLAELIHGAHESDMAFAVRADMRGQKIGTRLMERLIVQARIFGTPYGQRRVTVMFMSDNTPMRRLAVRAGMRVTTDGSECNAFRELDAPTQEEVTRWALEDGYSHSQYFSALMIARYGSLAAQSAATMVPISKSLQVLARAA
jgi:GNAT superfamily N-acetyltransferase